MRKIKIGIDVGGTFTHAVAVEVQSFSVIGKACVPTTHDTQQGVADGVVASMKKLIEKAEIKPDEIVLIAHSTTQATNALLEGDVAPVGVLAFGRGLEGRLARRQALLNDIELAPGKTLPVFFTFFNTTEEVSDKKIEEAIHRMQGEGARVFVASEAFGPDNNRHEKKVLEVASRMGVMATAACDLSQLYGMRVRTRTAIVNASMMPKMIETANMTEKAVRESGIRAPLMVMRSDGGIMDVNEMRKRPILTMLSGPAAGVAAALMYARISDIIFVEVGGTSSDISVIKNGMPQVKTAQIGNNRLSVKTIDVRTIGVAGGSVPRIHKNKVHDVGPRSAHIANLSYSAYATNHDFDDIELETICPKKGDPSDYLKIKRGDGNYTITPTAASYYLGLVKAVGHGEANLRAVKSAVENVARRIGTDAVLLAESILDITSRKVEKVVQTLIREYKLDPGYVVIYGGGGGASAIVPHAAKHMKMKHEIAENAEVISAIGAAMGMIRDTVERSIINPTVSDIIRIRQQAYESVIAMGANAESVEVQVEIDNANKKVIAVATGSSDLGTDRKGEILSDSDLLSAAAEALKVKASQLQMSGRTNLLAVASYERIRKHFFGLVAETIRPAIIITRDGVVRRKFDNVVLRNATVEGVKGIVSELIAELRSYGDGGELMPDVYVVVSGKIIDMSGLLELSQILSLVEYDLKGIDPQDSAIVLAVRKKINQDRTYEYIIWGSSPRGINRAIMLKKSGKKVLLASRFGFPGGKHTESLSAIFGNKPSGEDSLDQKILSRAARMTSGILHQNPAGIMLHPETIKRICWEWINEAGLPVLFHVLPAGSKQEDNKLKLTFFGREGFFELETSSFEDYADNIPFGGINPERNYNLFIHAFFSDPLPLHLPGFNLVRNIDTSIGRFVSISVRRVAGSEIDNTFNRELNRLSTEGWSKYRSRIRMIPVYPEIYPAGH